MKKLLPWQFFLLIIWPYVALAANLFLIRIALAAWLCALLGTLLVTAMNVHCALRKRDAFAAAHMGVLVKLIHIPAYALCLLMLPAIWMAPPLLLLMLLTNLCMLLATSAYTLRGLYLAWRGGKLSSGWAIALAVSQCIFVLDVPGSIVAYCLLRKKKAVSPAERPPC